jgi:hypothetical protein
MHNHHGCHVDCDPSADMPLPADVDALSALLASVRTDAMNEAAAMVDTWNIGLSKQDLLLAEEIRKLGGAGLQNEATRCTAEMKKVPQEPDYLCESTFEEVRELRAKHGGHVSYDPTCPFCTGAIT